MASIGVTVRPAAFCAAGQSGPARYPLLVAPTLPDDRIRGHRSAVQLIVPRRRRSRVVFGRRHGRMVDGSAGALGCLARGLAGAAARAPPLTSGCEVLA